MSILARGVAALVATLVVAGLAAPDQATGELRFRVLRPDGQPLARATVRVESIEKRPPFGAPPPPAVDVTTDEQGMAHVQWPAGPARVTIDAPDVGYGMTGLVEVVPGRPVTAPMPPLVPHATVEGWVPRELAGKDVEVRFGGSYGEEAKTVPVSPEGHFSARLRGGRWYVLAMRGRQRVAELGRNIDMAPGDAVRDLRLSTLNVQEQLAYQPHVVTRERPAEVAISWAEGTVRDESGKPIEGATVYAAATYHGGMRMYEAAEKAITDAAGHYAIKGKGGLSLFSAGLVACKPGWVPARDWITLPEPPWVEVPEGAKEPTTRMATPPAPIRDFVLSRRGGTLRVTVLMDQKPFAGAMVRLEAMGGQLRQIWAAGTAAPAQPEVEKIAYPTQTSGADGVAAFDLLPLGSYEVTASAGSHRVGIRFPGQPAETFAIAEGVPVRVGEATNFRMTIYAQNDSAGVRVTRADRDPLTGDNVPIEWAPVAGGGGWSSSIKLDSEGQGTKAFDAPGLWRVAFRYRESPARWIPLPEPYFAAEGFVAASPSLHPPEPAHFTAMRFNPGSIEVRLLDTSGRPVRGVVSIGQSVGAPAMVGSTDADGRATFEGVPTWKYLVAGMIPGRPRANIGNYGDAPLPDDAALRAANTFVPREPVAARPNTRGTVTLREQPAGYVRGFVRPPAGHSAGEFNIYMDAAASDQGAALRYRRNVGEFVAGPFAPGKVHLRVVAFQPNAAEAECAAADAPVEAGRVTRVEIPVPAVRRTGPEAASGSVLVGMSGVESQATGGESLAGRVMLADGTTPARGAMLLYFTKGEWQPRLGGATDVQGRIHGRGLWYSNSQPPPEPAGSPAGPVVIAMLPGAAGAAVVEPAEGKPLSIGLPKAVSLDGKVTIGGATLHGYPGRLRVLAGYKGRGKLDGVLSVWATPQDDGTFELAGLTPGHYTVQAALDGIWLSPSVPVVVADEELKPITLDIGAPGGPVVVQLVSPAGAPVAGQPVRVERPAGPLTTLYWPAEFTADGAGQAYIPALEVGTHIIRVGDVAAPHEVRVTAANAATRPPIVRIEAEPPRE
jgi:hypothetical protein